MARTINITAEIPLKRELRIMLPPDMPPGPAEHVMAVASHEHSVRALGDLVSTEFFGMWRDRTDIRDRAEFARQLRAESWRRAA
jgi:hypothetical protein